MNNYLELYKNSFKKYAMFTGRASREEFWIFYLGNLLIFIILTIFGGIYKYTSSLSALWSWIINLFYLVILVPSISVGVRRMHDTGREWWWFLIPILGLIFACENSNPDNNSYGPPSSETSAPSPRVAVKNATRSISSRSGMPKIQGILITSNQTVPKEQLDDLAQQILDSQKAKGHGFAEGCKVSYDNGVGNHAFEDMYAIGRIPRIFPKLGGPEIMKRTKKFPWHFPGGASGQFWVIYEYRA